MDTTAIQQQIGIYLAQGCDHDMILNILDGTREFESHPFEPIPTEEAVQLLKGIYEAWRGTDKALELTREDLVNWHVRQRLQLLRRALSDTTKEGQRTGLAILESLAKVQELTTETEGDTRQPCQVQFIIPQPKNASGTINKDDNKNGT